MRIIYLGSIWLLFAAGCGGANADDLFAGQGGTGGAGGELEPRDAGAEQLDDGQDAGEGLDAGGELDVRIARDASGELEPRDAGAEQLDDAGIATCPDEEKPTGVRRDSPWCTYWLRDVMHSPHGSKIVGCCKPDNVCGKFYGTDQRSDCYDLWNAGVPPYPPY